MASWSVRSSLDRAVCVVLEQDIQPSLLRMYVEVLPVVTLYTETSGLL